MNLKFIQIFLERKAFKVLKYQKVSIVLIKQKY
jgi:hypothetical protein